MNRFLRCESQPTPSLKSRTEDARQLVRRERQSKHRNKNSAPLPKPELKSPIDWRDWPAFEYYRSLRRLKRGLENDSAQALTLRAAAHVACLEPKYFSSFFHKKVGISFVAWRNSLRVEKAIEVIRKADYPLGHVADAAGFNDLRTFERAFKKHTGITPSEFKKSVLPATQ